jgi:hypothetical protein
LTAGFDPRDCPYIGLDPFNRAYEPFFFGRDQDSRVIADHVLTRPITVLYGPSGVGKSSVLNVGLPAALSRQKPWIIVTLRDWQDPTTLEARAEDAIRAALPENLRNRDLVRGLPKAKRPLLVILDQFEEYFLYRTGEVVTSAEQALSGLLTWPLVETRLLISLRDDSLHYLDKLRALFPAILETTVRLNHLSEAGARQAIRGPVQKYNDLYRQNAAPIIIKDELTDTLIRDLRQRGDLQIGSVSGQLSEPIELPYLQLTMTKLWDAEGGRDATALTLETLSRKLGGVHQIARQHVDTILNGLPEKEQALCADMFRNLVTSSGSKIAYPTKNLARQISEDRKQASGGSEDAPVSAEEVSEVLRKLTPTQSLSQKSLRKE